MSEVSSSFAGVVILYHPDDRVEENIRSYLPQLDLLVVFDNSPEISESLKSFFRSSAKIHYHGDGRNHGMAAGLNFGASKALEYGYQWLLTMDQDSRFETNALETIIQFSKNQKQVGIVSPRHDLEGKSPVWNPREYEEVSYVMTSGNLLNLQAYSKAGPFLEKLFIDYVDYEYCLRLRRAGYRVSVMNRAILLHSLGKIEPRSFLGLAFHPTNHSPERRYYMTRNRLYVMTKYPRFAITEAWAWAKEMVKFFLFEEKRILKLRFMIRGARDFFKGCYGPLKRKDI